MEIICSSCEKKINIPEDKIPAGKSFTLRCPACKGKVSVDLNPKENGDDLDASGWQQGPDEPDADYDASEKPFDFLEEEGLTAMVCENDPESVKKIREVLDIMEYSVTVPDSVRDALRKMKYHVYDLILVNESFDGSSPNANGILIYLERLNMSIRRNIFVGLISKQYATRDNMAAFLKSVNLTINERDVRHLDKLLKNAINDNELFFTIFKESMRKVGKI
jgi:hypothetical protein